MGFEKRACLGFWLGMWAGLLLLAAIPTQAAKPAGKTKDIVVLDHERWLDTLKGTVKNFSKATASDVTIVVKFLDRKKKALGTQRVNVGDMRSGDQNSWSLPIQEKNRAAAHYQFEVHAIWQ